MSTTEIIAGKPASPRLLPISFDFNSLDISNEVYFYLARKNTPQSVRDEALKRTAEGEKITKAKIDEMIAKARAEARAEAEAAVNAKLQEHEKVVSEWREKLDHANENYQAIKNEMDKKVQDATSAQRAEWEEQLEFLKKEVARAQRETRKAERELAKIKDRDEHIEVFAMDFQAEVIKAYGFIDQMEPKAQALIEHQDKLPVARIDRIVEYFDKISNRASDLANRFRREKGKVITIDSRRK